MTESNGQLPNIGAGYIIESASGAAGWRPSTVVDPASKKKYFADQKAVNFTLVKTAPLSLLSDVALLAPDANVSYDAQQGTDRKAMMAALAPLRRPEHLAAAKRANAYCGLSVTK